jgi:hypothetical protein
MEGRPVSDPCLRCVLPDCDIGSPRCIVRQLYNSYLRKVDHRQHDLITAEERQATREVFNDWERERLALAAEGVRPYRSPRSAWQPGQPRPARQP